MNDSLAVPKGRIFKDMAGAYSALYTPFRKDGSLNEEMVEKVVEYGISRGLKGFYLTVRRILRCHPWGGHGYDPVP